VLEIMDPGNDDSSVGSGSGGSKASSVSVSRSTTTGGNANKVAAAGHDLESDEIQRLVWKETRHVRLSRSFLLLLILAATTVIVTLSYAVFNNQDRKELALAVRSVHLPPK
jgi:hypothetical protein